MPGNIFVSYRRDDSKHAAGRLVDRLYTEFGPDQLFMDVDSIELGLDFVQVINDRVAACDVMLVIMGPNWIDAVDESGDRRLDNPNDFVRLEVEAALDRDIRVIPVLIDGAQPPRADDLPESLAPLANRQATRLDHISFSSDAEHLTKALARITEKAGSPLPDQITEAEPEPKPPAPDPIAEIEPEPAPASVEPQPSKLFEPTTADPPGFAEDTLLEEEIAEAEISEHATETPSNSQFIGIPEPQQPKAVGGDAPRMTRNEARDVLRRMGSRHDGIDRLGWFAALSPVILGFFLAAMIVLLGLQPGHFSWFGLPGERVAYSLPLIGALAVWSARGMTSRKPVSFKTKTVGGLLFWINVAVVVFAPT